MLDAKTLETIRTLAARLSADERLELVRVISEAAPADRATEQDAWSAALRAEAAYWYRRPAEERQPYVGQYVAVHRQTVVDHDPDRRALYLRVRARFPDVPVLLVEADAEAPREFTILSPRLERVTS